MKDLRNKASLKHLIKDRLCRRSFRYRPAYKINHHVLMAWTNLCYSKYISIYTTILITSPHILIADTQEVEEGKSGVRASSSSLLSFTRSFCSSSLENKQTMRPLLPRFLLHPHHVWELCEVKRTTQRARCGCWCDNKCAAYFIHSNKSCSFDCKATLVLALRWQHAELVIRALKGVYQGVQWPGRWADVFAFLFTAKFMHSTNAIHYICLTEIK